MATADGKARSSAFGEHKSERASVDELARSFLAGDKAAHLKSVVDPSNGGNRGWGVLKKALQPQPASASMALAARLSGPGVGVLASDNRGPRARWQELKARESNSSDIKAPPSWPVPARGSFFLRSSLDKLAERASAEAASDAGNVRFSGTDIRPGDIAEIFGNTSAKLISPAEATRLKTPDVTFLVKDPEKADNAMSGPLTEPAPEPGLESDHNEEHHNCNDIRGALGIPPPESATDTLHGEERTHSKESVCHESTASELLFHSEHNKGVSQHQSGTCPEIEPPEVLGKHACKEDALHEDPCTPDAVGQHAIRQDTPRSSVETKTENCDFRDSIAVSPASSIHTSAAVNGRSDLTRHSTVASLGDLSISNAPKNGLLDAPTDQHSLRDDDQEHVGDLNPRGEGGNGSAGTVAQKTTKLEIGRLMTNISTFSAAGSRARLARRKQKEERAGGVGTATLSSNAFGGSAADHSAAVVGEGSEEHFNAFGELDGSESRLHERVLELEQVRGVTLPESAARDRLGKRQKMRQTRKLDANKADGMGEHADEPAQETSAVALVVNFLGFAGYNPFQEQQEDEDGSEEEHNAWGEEDTEEKLQQRTLELEDARGFALGFQVGPAKTNARARLAKKKKRISTQASSTKQKVQLPGKDTALRESDSDEEFNPWGEDDTPEKKAERMHELDTGRLMVTMPTFAVGETDGGRKRLAKRKQKGKTAGNVVGDEKEQVARKEPESPKTGREEGTATFSSAAALVANVFAFAAYNPFGDGREAQDPPEEEHNAWGEADTEEHLHQRTLELEKARGLTMTYPTSPTKTNARTRLAKKIRARATKNLETAFPEKQLTDQRGSDDEFNPWGEDDSAEKTTQRFQELERARQLVNIPTFHSKANQSRDRLAKKKEKAKAAMDVEGAAATASDDQSGYFNGFSRMFFGDADYDDFDEDWNMWGEADSHADYLGRLAEFEDARRRTQQSFTKSERSPRAEKTHADISNAGASAAFESSQEALLPQAEDASPAKLKFATKRIQLPVRAIDRMKRRA
eukprot:TRINITY_DN9605_c0_g1_i1.p1 TRINITY_DN9605_c0_g1~~TRINITY_DN9605_c0_g1_i1.p1  ORF type:complete len:1035 (-),score=213.95 TRINITY_DN9605_c0_g1_i1:39-3143(-)